MDNSLETAQFYSFSWQPTPYLFGDLILLSLIRTLGAYWGAVVWSCLVFFSVPLAAVFFLSKRSQPLSRTAAANVFLLSTLIGFNWMFMMGFFNFQLGIAAYLVTLHFWLSAVEPPAGSTHSARRLLLLLLGSALCWFLHLSAFFFLSITVGTIALAKLAGKTRLSVLFVSCIPVGIVGLLAIAALRQGSLEQGLSKGELLFTPLQNKIRYFVSLNERYSWRIDDIVLLALFAYLAWGFITLLLSVYASYRDRDGEAGNNSTSIELLCTAAVCGFAFLALPAKIGPGVGFIDARAIPYGLLAAILSIAFHNRNAQSALSMAAPLAIVLLSLFSLSTAGIPYAKSVADYANLHRSIPPGKAILPITCSSEGIGGHPFGFHAHSTYASRSRGLVPYLFSNTRKQPQEYFDFKNLPSFVPEQTWCTSKRYVSLRKAAQHFDYLILDQSYRSHQPLVEELNLLTSSGVLGVAHRDQAGIVFKSSLRDSGNSQAGSLTQVEKPAENTSEMPVAKPAVH